MEGTLGDRRGHTGTGGDTRGPRGDNPASPSAPGDTGSAVSLPSPSSSAERSPRDPAGDTEPDGDKVCAVCGDRASGYHFHVMSCEGCKGFFRRSVIKGVRFTCPLARRCPVTKAKRRQCQACRLQKCLDVGMRKDMIMSEEALRRRRELRGQRGQPGGQQGHSGGLTAEQQELISLLIAAHRRTFDSSFSQFMRCWPLERLLVPSPPCPAVAAGMSPSPVPAARVSPVPTAGMSPSPVPAAGVSPSPVPAAGVSLSPVPAAGVSLSPVPAALSPCPCEAAPPNAFSMLPQIADLSTFMIQQVINFAKEIPVFRTLPMDTQISLLKGATLGICQIRFNTVFNARTKAWECGQRCYTIRDGALAGFQQIYLEPLLKFHESLRRLRLHEAEYVLLQAMLLFSPEHVGIAQRDIIDQFQEKVAVTLQSYIDHQHPPPEGRFLYAKLLLLLTELQTLKVENTRQILHIQDLSAMTPLLSEIIS